MKDEGAVLRAFAQETASCVSKRTIAMLQKVEATPYFGKGKGLKNAWDEVCVQLQYDQTFLFKVYKEVMAMIVAKQIRDLKRHEKLALWFQTYEGESWLYDEGDPNDEPPMSIDEIGEYIVAENLIEEGRNWSNQEIRACLEYCGSIGECSVNNNEMLTDLDILLEFSSEILGKVEQLLEKSTK